MSIASPFLALTLAHLVVAAAWYVAAINLGAIILGLVGYLILRAEPLPLSAERANALLKSPMLPGISIILDVPSEAAGLRVVLEELLRLPYHEFEVIALVSADRIGNASERIIEALA